MPSPGLFQQHFKALENSQGKPITQIDFRTKARGWKGPLELFLSVEFDGARTLTYAALDAYYALFLANISLRPCCFACKFASTQRPSDLTLGDFWGVKKHYPQLFDSKGTSLILANTEQGQRLLQSLQGVARIEPLSEVRPFPPNLAHPTRQPKYRERFFNRVNLTRWHPRRRWFHVVALAIIARDKLLGLIKRKL